MQNPKYSIKIERERERLLGKYMIYNVGGTYSEIKIRLYNIKNITVEVVIIAMK